MVEEEKLLHWLGLGERRRLYTPTNRLGTETKGQNQKQTKNHQVFCISAFGKELGTFQ